MDLNIFRVRLAILRLDSLASEDISVNCNAIRHALGPGKLSIRTIVSTMTEMESVQPMTSMTIVTRLDLISTETDFVMMWTAMMRTRWLPQGTAGPETSGGEDRNCNGQDDYDEQGLGPCGWLAEQRCRAAGKDWKAAPCTFCSDPFRFESCSAHHYCKQRT